MGLLILLRSKLDAEISELVTKEIVSFPQNHILTLDFSRNISLSLKNCVFIKYIVIWIILTKAKYYYILNFLVYSYGYIIFILIILKN